jgi:glycosyltransferase involved in cell wall biosynthesis
MDAPERWMTKPSEEPGDPKRRESTTNRTRDHRLQVVHVNLGLDIGGAEKLLVEFARHTDRDRFALRFVCLNPRGILADDIEACGWPVTALAEPPGVRWGLIWRLRRLFRQWHVDVVHTHNTKPLLYACPGARLARVPVVVHTRHGQRWQASRATTNAFRFVQCLVDRIVCVSQDSARLSAAEGISPSRVCTIWNGINVTQFGEVGPTIGGPVVMVGRLSPEKDVGTLVRAASIALRDNPSFQIQVAGSGECLPTLRQLTRELDLEDNFHFLEEVRNIPDLLASASLLVLPSLTEGISLTLLEAMARGLPVVATRVGGNPEVVVDGETGLLVPAGDPAALARAILRLQRNPDESRRMGKAARHRVEQYFDVRRMVADYEALYLELGARRGLLQRT